MDDVSIERLAAVAHTAENAAGQVESLGRKMRERAVELNRLLREARAMAVAPSTSRDEEIRRSAYLDGMRNAADEIGAFNTWQNPQVFAEHLRAIADSIEARKIREG